MDPVKCVGSCVPVFLMAVAFDIAGLVLLFVGIFADLRVDGRFYGDFLIYTGSVVVFFSLGCWLMWYVANVRVSEDEDGFGTRSSIVRLARKISERLTRRLKREERPKRAGDEESVPGGTPEPRSGRVTWGKATVYNNEGYDSSMDSPDLVKKETF